jgi:NAD(P)-dependent dehydrogenase (short-subunit alcohol dehydrogenase family)
MSVPSLSLDGKVALVTGAGSIRGMGRVIALTFAEAGADVAVCDVHATGESYDLEGTAAEIRKRGRRALALQTDVTQENQVISLMDKVVQEFGKIGILVNNAGVSAHETFLGTTTDLWDKAMDVNLKGVFMCCREAGKIMAKQQGGNIVNISSIGGLKHGTASPYGIAKAGVIVLTGWAARELAQYNIRVNAIAPGGVGTDFGLHRIGRAPWEVLPERPESQPQEKPRQGGGPPLGRFAEPQDIADTALFLASDASHYITGDTIIVDGGTMLMG